MQVVCLNGEVAECDIVYTCVKCHKPYRKNLLNHAGHCIKCVVEANASEPQAERQSWRDFEKRRDWRLNGL